MMMERYPNLNEEVGGAIPGCEISSLLDRNLPCSQLPPMLGHWHVELLSLKRKRKKKKTVGTKQHVHSFLGGKGFRHPTKDECMGWFAQILGNPRILTDYAQKSARHCSAPNHPPLKYRCHIEISNRFTPTHFNEKIGKREERRTQERKTERKTNRQALSY